MPSYMNRKGERVEVSPEHIDTAIRIKEELQKASPSNRTSWPQHRRMMIAEGFNDSDVNEAYRCLVKYEQSKLRSDDGSDKQQTPIQNSTLKSIEQEVGNIKFNKLEMQRQGRALNKLKRDLSYEVQLQTEVADAVRSHHFDNGEFAPVFTEDDYGSEMIAVISDIHFGADVDLAENQYNPAIAQDLLEEYAGKIIEYIENYAISKVHIVNLGDCIENAYMRLTQAYASDLTVSEQVVQVADLLISFIKEIAQYVRVDYRGIVGNHDRINPNKNDNIHTDSVVTFINKIIETYFENDSSVTYIKAAPYFTNVEMKGFNFGFVHGDLDNMSSKTALSQISTAHDMQLNSVIAGHVHHFQMTEVGKNKYQVTFGSIKGTDSYAQSKNLQSCRSQGLIIADDSDYQIIKVNL